MKPFLKLGIAVLLLLCLADMPYGFYTLVRFSATAAFAYLAYDSFKSKEDGKGFFFAALAVLFQPFYKFALGRVVWNIVDVMVAVILFCLIVKSFNNKKK